MTDTNDTNTNSSSTSRLKVPQILRSLLESFAREALKNKPNDFVDFGQIYFETFLLLRKQMNCSEELILQDKGLYDVFRADLEQRVQQADMWNCGNHSPPAQLTAAATKIQAAFRGHLVRAHPEKYSTENGDTVSAGRRCSTDRRAKADNRKDLKRHSVGGYSHAELQSATPEDRAATKIQSEIRGYLVRKHYEQQKEETNKAATKIQAHIRGYLSRKKLEEKGLTSPPCSRSSNDFPQNQ